MSKHPTTGFDLDEVDRLLTTTKQVRKRLDLTRPVPVDALLEIIEIANHAPMGGNLERNRWMIVTDAELKDHRRTLRRRWSTVSGGERRAPHR